jgi:hypothetical protein
MSVSTKLKPKAKKKAKRPANGKPRGKKAPRVNAHGVYIQGVHQLKVPIRKTAGIQAVIRLVCDGGMWHVAVDVRDKDFAAGGLPSANGPSYSTRKFATNEGAASILRILEANLRGSCSDAARARIRNGIEDVQAFAAKQNGKLPVTAAGPTAAELGPFLPARRYLDPGGRIIEVSAGLVASSKPDCWIVGRTSVSRRSGKPNGSHHRLKSPRLPVCATRDEAQANLDKYAIRCKLREYRSILDARSGAYLEQEASKANGKKAPLPVTTIADAFDRAIAKEKKQKTAKPGTALVPITPGKQLELLPPPKLSAIERKQLLQAEREIERNIGGFVAVGNALSAINQQRLYRATHATFEAYVQERWNLSRPYAYQLMDAAEINAGVSGIADKLHLRLSSESHFRPLKDLEPADRIEVLKLAAKQAPKFDDGTPRVTAEVISRAKRAYTTPTDDLDRAAERKADREEVQSAKPHDAELFGDEEFEDLATVRTKAVVANPHQWLGKDAYYAQQFHALSSQIANVREAGGSDMDFQTDLLGLLRDQAAETEKLRGRLLAVKGEK